MVKFVVDKNGIGAVFLWPLSFPLPVLILIPPAAVHVNHPIIRCCMALIKTNNSVVNNKITS
jgi:hypothetical protein